MGGRKGIRVKERRALKDRYIKPFTKRVAPLVSTNDKRYISSGRNFDEVISCKHDYCLAERKRAFGFGLDDGSTLMKPTGLPWCSGLLLYMPGHKKITFPLRKPRKIFIPKIDFKLSSFQIPIWKPDKITNPEICSILDEMIYAYKVFLLAGMLINEAKEARTRHINEGLKQKEGEKTEIAEVPEEAPVEDEQQPDPPS